MLKKTLQFKKKAIEKVQVIINKAKAVQKSKILKSLMKNNKANLQHQMLKKKYLKMIRMIK